MSNSAVNKIIVLFIIVLNAACNSDSAETLYATNDTAALVIYESDLQSIIEEKCISCHDYHLEGANRYDTYDKTKSSIAQIIQRINSNSNTIMPPATSEAGALTDNEIAVFNNFLTALNSDNDDEIIEVKPIEVNWTAYKFPDRFTAEREGAGVSGTFDTVEYTFNTDAVFNTTNINVIDILEDAMITINTSSVNVGGEGERTDNVGMFFEYFSETIIGTVTGYSNTSADVVFEMNGISETVTLNVEVLDDSNQIILSGSIPDLTNFNWQAGYDALESVCGGYHENKLWPDVDIEVIISSDKL